MKQNKLVIFDWGGVIESHDETEYNVSKATIDFLKRFRINMSDDEILEKYIDCCHDITNTNSQLELFHKIKDTFHLECNLDEYTQKYYDDLSKIEYYQDVVKLAHSLKEKCYIGILSNLTPFDKERLNNQVDLSKFDYVWLSFELECRKPNPKIYDIVEESIDFTNEHILFIDDLEKNLVIPKEKGWHTCQATGHEIDKIKKSIETFLQN